MEKKYDKRWTVYWSFMGPGETHKRTYSNTFDNKHSAEQLFWGLCLLGKANNTLKAKIVEEEVIEAL